jgi:hypothetical protein
MGKTGRMGRAGRTGWAGRFALGAGSYRRGAGLPDFPDLPSFPASGRCFVLTAAVCVLHLVPLHPAPAQTTPAAPSVRFMGYIQARETYRDEVGLIGSINRARLTAYGKRGQGRNLAGAR